MVVGVSGSSDIHVYRLRPGRSKSVTVIFFYHFFTDFFHPFGYLLVCIFVSVTVEAL